MVRPGRWGQLVRVAVLWVRLALRVLVSPVRPGLLELLVLSVRPEQRVLSELREYLGLMGLMVQQELLAL